METAGEEGAQWVFIQTCSRRRSRGSLKEGCVLQKGVSLELPWGSRELVVSLEKGGWLGQMLGGVVLGISRFALGLVTSPPPFFGTSCF